MKKKIIILVSIIVIFIVFLGVILLKNNFNDRDNIKFSKEYTSVSYDNVFIYKSIDEVINIIEGGTGIVYLGFPECPWCQKYVKLINDVAKENNIKEIYYFNILEDRKNNTNEYQKLVSLLEKYLSLDESNNHRIYVPDLVFVRNGKILNHDNETSIVDAGESIESYWTDQKIQKFKNKISMYMDDFSGICFSCN